MDQKGKKMKSVVRGEKASCILCIIRTDAFYAGVCVLKHYFINIHTIISYVLKASRENWKNRDTWVAQ